MYDLVRKLETLYPIPQKEAWQTTINLAKIETPNTTFNKVPDECTAWLDIRVIPEGGKHHSTKDKKMHYQKTRK